MSRLSYEYINVYTVCMYVENYAYKLIEVLNLLKCEVDVRIFWLL